MNVLIVDNWPHNQSTLNARLTKINEINHINLKIDIVPKPNDAMQHIKSISYDFIFLDLKLSDEDLKPNEEPLFDGIQLCDDIRRFNSSTIIILYSTDIKHNREISFPYYSECEKAGADLIISKSHLFNMNPQQLYELMIKQKETRETLLLNNRPILFDDDIKTNAFLETLGKSTISEIVYNLVPGMVDYKLSVIEPGYSNAFVFIVKSSTNENNQFNIENVIKISPFRNTLDAELKKAPIPGSYLHSLSVTPTSNEQLKIGDFYCIKIPKVRNAKILSDVLLFDKLTKTMKNTFTLLLKSLVVEPIGEAFSWEYSKGIISDNYSLSYVAGYEILKNLEIIISATTILKKKEINQAIFLYDFLTKYFGDSYKFTNEIHKITYLHGDLHCRNIFYISSQNPILIDFGRSTVFPRLFDAAALNVDLLITQMDSTKGKSNDLSNLDSWINVYKNQYPFVNKNDLIYHDPVLVLLSMLNESLITDIKDISKLEYAEVLVFQLFRYIRFPNITFPKKVLIVSYLYNLIKRFMLKK
jgi:CheY-like chemotaxis protein